MLVVALNGSPRKKGNTQILLDAALEGARHCGAEVVRIDLNDLGIKGCQACDSCPGSAQCIIDDDMEQVYRLIEQADALIIGTPIYFSGPTAQLKVAIDRCQCIWSFDPIRKGRRSAIISVGAESSANFKNAVSEVHSLVNSIGFERFEELLLPGIDKKGAVEARPDLLERARAIGSHMTLP